MLRSLKPALLVSGFLAWACAPTAFEEAEEILVLEVAPETVECVGEAVERCLRVRRPPSKAWENFHGPIEGFEHDEGFRYLIEVGRRRVPDPPADASSLAYRLVRILEREPG